MRSLYLLKIKIKLIDWVQVLIGGSPTSTCHSVCLYLSVCHKFAIKCPSKFNWISAPTPLKAQMSVKIQFDIHPPLRWNCCVCTTQPNYAITKKFQAEQKKFCNAVIHHWSGCSDTPFSNTLGTRDGPGSTTERWPCRKFARKNLRELCHTQLV